MRTEDKIAKSLFRIYEGLCKQIKESSESEINAKLDIIMDALGLKEDEEKEVETEKEEVIEELPKEEEDKEDEKKLVIEDKSEEIEESVKVSETKKYKINFMDSRAYATDYDKISDEFTEPNAITFDTLDEVIKFLMDHHIIRYNDIDRLMNADEDKEKGLIYVTSWYEVAKEY